MCKVKTPEYTPAKIEQPESVEEQAVVNQGERRAARRFANRSAGKSRETLLTSATGVRPKDRAYTTDTTPRNFAGEPVDLTPGGNPTAGPKIDVQKPIKEIKTPTAVKEVEKKAPRPQQPWQLAGMSTEVSDMIRSARTGITTYRDNFGVVTGYKRANGKRVTK